MNTLSRWIGALAIACCAVHLCLAQSTTWHELGPISALDVRSGKISGRVMSIAGDPHDRNVIYIATASSGVWKTMNGGTTWQCLTNAPACPHGGAITVDPNNSQVLYYGPGDPAESRRSYPGPGIYVSRDGGATWSLQTNGLPSHVFTNKILTGTTPRPDLMERAWATSVTSAGGTSDIAALTTDPAGNVYAAGANSGAGTQLDLFTAKFDTSGNVAWTARYDGSSHNYDKALAIAYDLRGFVYVVGQSMELNHTNYAVIKYDTAGHQLWVKNFTEGSPAGSQAWGVVVAKNGDVVVTGGSTDGGTGAGAAVTIWYDQAGTMKWISRFGGKYAIALGGAGAKAVATDTSGYVYVLASVYDADSLRDFVVLKYDSLAKFSGTWPDNGDGPGVRRIAAGNRTDDLATFMAVTPDGRVVATGTTTTSSGTQTDWFSAYIAANGQVVWSDILGGAANSWDEPGGVGFLPNGDIAVSGYTEEVAATDALTTVRYNAGGGRKWVQHYLPLGDSRDEALAMVTDRWGDIFACGFSKNSNGMYRGLTVAYDSSGALLWSRLENFRRSYCMAHAITTNAGGDVFSGALAGAFGGFVDLSVMRMRMIRPKYLLAALGGSPTGKYTGGLFRSADSAATWTSILAGPCDDIATTRQGDTVYASTRSGGMQVSYNCGRTFKALSPSVDTKQGGRIVICADHPQHVYFLALKHGGNGFSITVMHSTDAGQTFSIFNNLLRSEQGPYNLTLSVSPSDPTNVIVGTEKLYRLTGQNTSVDDGGTVGGLNTHADQHACVFHPADATLQLLGNDGGVWNRTVGQPWAELNDSLPTIQAYDVGTHPDDSDVYFVGTQDNGAILFDGASWKEKGNGDIGTIFFDDADTVTAVEAPYGFNVEWSNDDGDTWKNTTVGTPVGPFVLVQHPSRPGTIVGGLTALYVTTDAGKTWDKSMPFSADMSGSITGLAMSADAPDLIFVMLDKTLYRSDTFGKNWKGLQTLLVSGTITSLRMAPDSAQMLIVGATNKFNEVDGGDVLLSVDSGSSFVRINGAMPITGINDVAITYPSRTVTRILAATDTGVFASTDRGASWSMFGDGLPAVPVLKLEPGPDRLRIATFGRGIWELKGAFVPPDPAALRTPLKNFVGEQLAPTFRWTRPRGTSTFKLDIATDSNFKFNVFNQSPITDTSFRIAFSILRLGTTYYWRVTAANDAGVGRPSETWKFSTAPAVAVHERGALVPRASWLDVAPLPADKSVSLVIHESIARVLGADWKVSIVDALGRTRIDDVRAEVGDVARLDVSSLASGYYRCVARRGGEEISAALQVAR